MRMLPKEAQKIRDEGGVRVRVSLCFFEGRRLVFAKADDEVDYTLCMHGDSHGHAAGWQVSKPYSTRPIIFPQRPISVVTVATNSRALQTGTPVQSICAKFIDSASATRP